MRWLRGGVRTEMRRACLRAAARGLVVLLLAFTSLLWTEPVGAQGVALTPAERAFVRNAPVVVVGVQSDYAPFSFVGSDGVPSGYSNELFALVDVLEERVEIRVASLQRLHHY